MSEFHCVISSKRLASGVSELSRTDADYLWQTGSMAMSAGFLSVEAVDTLPESFIHRYSLIISQGAGRAKRTVADAFTVYLSD